MGSYNLNLYINEINKHLFESQELIQVQGLREHLSENLLNGNLFIYLVLFFSFKLTKTLLRWSLHSTGRRQIMKFICKYIYVFIYIKSSSYVLKKIFKNGTQNAMSADLEDKVLPCTQTLAFTFPPLFFSTLHLLKHFKKICLFYLSSIFFQ